MLESRLIAPDSSALEAAVADLVVGVVRGSDRRCHVFLAGGRTPRGVYARLAKADAPWERCSLYWGDERAVPRSSSDSNYGAARAVWLNALAERAPEVHPIEAERGPEQAAARYDALVRSQRMGSLHGVPRADLVLLGIGADGHTASLFPGDAALDVHDALFAPTAGEHGGHRRITATLPFLCAARRIVFMAVGRDKASAVARAAEPLSEPRVPSALIRPEDGELTWALDAEAAAELSPRFLERTAPRAPELQCET